MILGFWTWVGWSALVAIGTILLAAATAGLAWFTYQVTRDSRDELRLESRRLEAAQRPIVLPAALVPAHKAMGDRRRALLLMNAGPGAALNIICTLRWPPPSGVIVAFPQFHLRPNGSIELPFVPPQNVDFQDVSGTVECDDIAGSAWTTSFTISMPGPTATDPAIDVTPPVLTSPGSG